MKLTPWFDGCQKPVRAGLYRRNFAGKFPAGMEVRWSHWDGFRWGASSDDKQRAVACSLVASGMQCLPWRGIAGPEQ